MTEQTDRDGRNDSLSASRVWVAVAAAVAAGMLAVAFASGLLPFRPGEDPVSGGSPEGVGQIKAVSGISSSGAIALDIARGRSREASSGTPDRGNGSPGHRPTHLLWQAGGAVRYRRLGGPEDLSPEPSSGTSATLGRPGTAGMGPEVGGRPRVFAHGGAVAAFWWDPGAGALRTLISSDGGRTWPKTARTVFRSRSIAGGRSITRGRYSLAAEGEHVHLAFSNRDGVFFAGSEDFGKSWERPVKVGSAAGTYRSDPPGIATSQGENHLLWTQGDTLLWARSPSGGRTWNEPVRVETDRSRFGDIYEGRGYSISQPTITASETGILALYRERGVFYHWKAGPETPWSEPRALSLRSAFQLEACNTETRGANGRDDVGAGPLVAWADTRHRTRSWWDIIPGAQLFADPFWADSDLFVQSVSLRPVSADPAREEPAEDPLRLTPPRSLVSAQSEPALLCEGGTTTVFWSGRKKVGKTPEAYGYPTRIFVRSVEANPRARR